MREDAVSSVVHGEDVKDKRSLEAKVKEVKTSGAEESSSIPEVTSALELTDIPEMGVLALPLQEYSFREGELLSDPSYAHPSVDYDQLWYNGNGEYTGARSAFAEDENGRTITNDAEAEIIPVEEAQESFQKMQYAAIVGAFTEVNFEERRKLSLLFLFQRDVAALLESTMTLTRDVNYSYGM